MQFIKVIRDPNSPAIPVHKVVTELCDEVFGRVMEVGLETGGVLSKHKANEPITVMCISGHGVFRAGKDLEESQALNPGTVITLGPGVEHDVTADDHLRLIVTKFKNSQE